MVNTLIGDWIESKYGTSAGTFLGALCARHADLYSSEICGRPSGIHVGEGRGNSGGKSTAHPERIESMVGQMGHAVEYHKDQSRAFQNTTWKSEPGFTWDCNRTS